LDTRPVSRVIPHEDGEDSLRDHDNANNEGAEANDSFRGKRHRSVRLTTIEVWKTKSECVNDGRRPLRSLLHDILIHEQGPKPSTLRVFDTVHRQAYGCS